MSHNQSAIFLIFRRLRTPLIMLIVIMAISVLGLTLAPGLPDDEGKPQFLSFFHALYFISYTATTIGFGEIPADFSNQQRLWVIVCIYMSVVGWAYTLGSVFSLLSDKNLRLAISEQRFGRSVRRLREPFYLVCGYGETGRLICDALDHLGHRVVVIEKNETRAGQVELHPFKADVPVLNADASAPETLRLAGIAHPHCAGVLALTDDDDANLAVAITARLLAPRLPTLCRATRKETAANMASFGTRHIINPFQKFAEYLELALHAPAAWKMLIWLTSLPGASVEQYRDPPRGNWVLCGHGRFGRFMAEALEREEVPLTIIDQSPPTSPEYTWIVGDGTGAEALIEAGTQTAAGIIACTSSDVDNLSVVVTARDLNPSLYVITRQNHYSNHALFEAFRPDLNMIPSEVIAHECLAVLTTPLLMPFLDWMKNLAPEECAQALRRLTRRYGWNSPSVWSERLNISQSPALHHRLMNGEQISLERLLRQHQNRDKSLACSVLMIQRDDDRDVFLPNGTENLKAGDELLLVGRPESKGKLELLLKNEHSLHYVLNGTERYRSWVWRRFVGTSETRSSTHRPYPEQEQVRSDE